MNLRGLIESKMGGKRGAIAKLSKLLHRPHNTVSQWINLKSPPDTSDVQSLSEALNIPVAELIKYFQRKDSKKETGIVRLATIKTVGNAEIVVYQLSGETLFKITKGDK